MVLSKREERESFSEFLRKSLCAVIPKPSSTIPNYQLPPTSKEVKIKGEFADKTKYENGLARSKTEPLAKGTTPLQSLKGADLFYFNLRSMLNCGDIYPDCEVDKDCPTLNKCINKLCFPDVNHCSVSGCSSDKRCNAKTGECESQLKSCESDTDCGSDFTCDDTTKKCVRVRGTCVDDTNCTGFTDQYGVLKPKCNTITKECVECKPNTPTVCGKIEFGKDPAKPSCDPITETCYPSCKAINEDNVEPCCDSQHLNLNNQPCCGANGSSFLYNTKISNPDLGNNLVGKCCNSITQFAKDGYGVDPSISVSSTRASECCRANWSIDLGSGWKCALDENNSGLGDTVNKRDCRQAWGGKQGGLNQCEYGYSCITSGANVGKCMP